MRELFTSVLTSGLYGSVIILAVLLFRFLARKTPGKWLCLLWLLAFLRLAMPFQIESSFSLQPDTIRFVRENESVGTVQPMAPVQTIVPAVPEDAELPDDVTVSYGDAITPPVVSDDPVVQDTPTATINPGISDTPAETHMVIDWLAVGGWVWLAGCICFCGYGLISYLRLKHRVREAVRCADGAWECAGLETAFILGFLKPRIYIPMGTSYGREFILTHERGHIARGDHWWKLLGYLVLAVYWFNPLVWAAYLLLCRDMERACDERVVRDMSLEERKAYSTALLNCSTNRTHFAACPVAFGEISVKDRIKNVLNYRKPGFWVILTAVAAVVILVVCFLTTPKSADPIEQCREALELLKNKESYHVLIDADYEGNEEVLRSHVESEYWKQGDDWAYREFPASDTATWWIKEENGVIYELESAVWEYPDLQSIAWRKADGVSREELVPWFESFVWDGSQISLEGWEVTEDGETITLSVSDTGASYLLTFTIDGTGSLTGILRHSMTVNGEAQPGTLTTTILETMKPVDTTMAQDHEATLEESMIQKCVDAMVELQNTEKFTVYSLERMDWRYKSNGYTRTEQGWNCYFSDSAWDYDLIRWLNYNGEQYIYDEVFDEEGNVIDTYRWQADPNPEEHPFALPFPFDLDWENVDLVFQGRETKFGQDYILMEYPAKRKLFAFSFGDGDRLQVLHVSDYFGGMPSNTVEFTIAMVNGSEADMASRLYEEASGLSPKPLVVRDDAFYGELFGRKPNSLYFSEWTNDLFDTLFIQPEEFVRKFTRLYAQDQSRAEEILSAMSMNAQNNAPYRFDRILEELRQNPALDQTIVELLGQRLQEWEVPSSIVVS